jgi:hypothetical protein
MKNKLLASTIFLAILLLSYWLSIPEQKKIDLEMRLAIGKPDPECGTSQSFLAQNCHQYLSTNLVIREEWATLFPKADFYLVETKQIQNFETNMNGFVQDNFIIVKQGLQAYKDKDFDDLLRDNKIIISTENLELVLKAFAWITAANYLNEDVSFSALEAVHYTTAETDYPYNYHLIAMTEVDHIELHWFFVVQDNKLQIATYQSPAPMMEYFFSQ